MSDSHTTTRTVSYGENVKNSISGAIFGLVLFLVSFGLLWWNEGHSVAQIQKANYAGKNAIAVSSEKIDRQNDNKLISVSGVVNTDETLSDGIITVPNALVLDRDVKMYQWEEDEKTEKKDNLGGSTTETTTYTYKKVWSGTEINSSNFYDKSHVNPKFNIESKKLNAKTGTMGEFKINETQTERIKASETFSELPQNETYKIAGTEYYSGKDINNPEIGDIRISYTYAPSGAKISVIGLQREDKTITPMQMKNGSIYMQYDGLLTQDEIINKFKKHNSIMTNILRVVGFLLMFFALNLMVDPIITVLKVIPFLSHITSFISTGILFVVALVLSLLTIAIAWFANRPLLSIALIAVIVGLVIWIMNLIKAKKNQAEEAQPEKNI